jgi:outer membrane protein OmpA-like peptidoglycan-associated protein
MLLPEPLFSQDVPSAPLHGLSAKFLLIDYFTPNGLEDFKLGNGLELAYLRTLNDNLGIGIPLKVGVANIGGNEKKSTIASIDFTGHYLFSKAADQLKPYAFGGVGFVTESLAETNLQIPLGLGLYYRVGESSFLTAQAEYRKSFVENRDNIQIGIGWNYKLKPVPPPPPDKIDTDKDGTPDVQDACPREAGPRNTYGCPDADGDLTPDKTDKCPAEAGSPANSGCPEKPAPVVTQTPPPTAPPAPPQVTYVKEDSDGDGLVDSKDACPDEPGKIMLMGCPDTDEDGIADKDDRCPTAAGLPENNGCPLRDSDQDGVQDDADRCPDLKGTAALNGCPDSDGDGIIDPEDNCPKEAGKPATGGCPDKDADGIPDKDDRCPDKAGIESAQGCPDTDGDGVLDNEDDCPELKGLKTAKGCPDADNDGFSDSTDKCPDEKGTNQGCPDLDKTDKDFLEFAASNIQFETGRASLKALSFQVLDQIAGILTRYPRYSLSIEGHTDNVGTAPENLALSQERALSCYEYLISRNINAERMSYVGFGSSKPLADNNTPEGREKNRRVVFRVYIK